MLLNRGSLMEMSDKTARQMFEGFKANPTRRRFGFGQKPALINVDLQKAYTLVGEYPTAYQTDPRQIEYVNALAQLFRAKNRSEERRVGKECDSTGRSRGSRKN